jgi:glucokinase
MRDSVLGIDIGGSHMTAALVNLETRSLVQGTLQREAVNSNDTADNILACWCKVIDQVFDGAKVAEKHIGIAMPGPFDYQNGISLIQDQEKFRSLYQLDLKQELAARLHIKPSQIRFLNDAAGFLQGEVFGGAARGGKRVIGLTLGTGLGSAFLENGIAEDAALWQSPFKGGIAEDYLSTRWFIHRYFQHTGTVITGVKELTALDRLSPDVYQIFNEFGKTLAEFLSPFILKRRADVVVLGGNIANAHPHFLPALMAKLLENKIDTTIKIAELKEVASLIGAASCWELLHQS